MNRFARAAGWASEKRRFAVVWRPGMATVAVSGRNGPALKELQEAVSLKPDDAEAYLYLGYACHRAGD